MTVETFEFKSESQQVLNLMIHSLYSNKEIFLRELISNASDALDKLRFESLTKPELLGTDILKIQLSTNEEQRTITIEDNGIGMNKEELIKNLGTIAHSGTKAFLEQIKTEKQSKEAVSQLIGQFGVGFYSSFIVADKVEVTSLKAGTTSAFKWTSTGDGKFNIETAQRDKAGTSIVLYLKNINTGKSDEDLEAGLEDDFTREYVLERVIKKYSDFVQYPIELQVIRWVDAAGNESEYEEDFNPEEEADDAEPKADKPAKVKTSTWKQINSMKAIWSRDPKDVTDEEYETFYQHVSKNRDQPLERIRHKTEGGSFDYTYLVFIPSESNQSVYYRDQKHGLQLYVNRVMIMETCEDLIPEYFRFIKGVVESPDLSLNVSREILQQDKKLKIIRTRLIKKLIDTLEDLQTKDRAKYEKFWEKFGNVVKEGIIDFEHADRLKNLFLFKSSTQEGYTTLKEYIGRMKEGQKEIYYITSENLDTEKITTSRSL
jgi:molecular chaperone HtpG